jgi:preprotein translocase subunit SecA
LRNVRYSAAEDPVQGASAMLTAATAEPDDMGAPMPEPVGVGTTAPAPQAAQPEPVAHQPVRVEKTPGRNEPCFCGSGKKYKLCHGRA